MSLCKQNYSSESEAAVNRQINTELKASHTYLALAAYFARDNVALPGLRKFFQKSSDEEREHAEKLIAYQTMRGGKVNLGSVPEPETEWKSARNAVEIALQMEKDVNKSLLELHEVRSICF
jgi:ferritin heavy chain